MRAAERAAAAALLAASVAAPAAALAEYRCRGVVCDVEVVVVEAPDRSCAIEFVDRDQRSLRMPGATRHLLLRWALAAGADRDYEFRDDGFSLKSGASTDQFDKVGATSGGKRFVLKNRNDDGRSYEYALRVHDRRDAGRSCVVDPFIHNTH